ncbi:MAG: Uroporphyrinogen decarboxylase (URO-D) domain protein [Candidatus Syntrophoarchaeum caldarius]|uniref:Uroporphyrinogen decarboxylase (URO-D) domain protein n=1 Tax=Candidatus Syntropharchaeum caldarium TaxID=1838285 RepID=A0A1F2P7M6_9EURY|nr:MAG: Uroporphyrinogen decarboxylase (URO-D) domain protein [Candidatus Syntrophoarchaeum caldarius]
MSETMSPIERFHAAMENNPIDRVSLAPVTQTGTTALMEKCGAYWPEAHKDPKLMAQLSWAAYEYGGLEGVRIPFYVYTEAEATGAKLSKWKKKNHPVVDVPSVPNLEAIDKLEIPDPKKDGRMPQILEAIKILVPKCKQEKLPIITSVIAPLTMTLNAGVTDAMQSMLWWAKNPNEMDKLIKKTLEIGLVWAEAAYEAGSDTIFYNGAFDASVTPDDYEKRVIRYHIEGVRKLKEMGAYVVYHSCMDISPVIDKLPRLEAHAISVSQEMDMAKAREIVGENVILAGNVDPTYTLIKKSPEEVLEESKYCIDAGTDILCPGCGYGPNTPLENMTALAQAGREYGHNARLAKKN